MNSIFSGILGSLLVYRYLALFVITFLTGLGFPLPAAPATIAASAFAGQGFLNLFWVLLSGSLGNILGDLTMYWLCQKYGVKILFKLRLKKLVESVALKNIEKTVDTYKFYVVIASRFQVQATALVNTIAGLGSMNFRKFCFLVIVGEILQMIFYVSLGYFFADSWQEIFALINRLGWVIALTIMLGITYASGKIIGKGVK